MRFCNYSCHVTPLYKIVNVLKLNDIYRLELAKFMHKLHHGALPKNFDNFLKNISNIHLCKTRFADNQNYFMQCVCTNSGKKSISYRGIALWKEIEQNLKILPYVTFCKHCKDSLFNYEWFFAQPYMAICFLIVKCDFMNMMQMNFRLLVFFFL